MFRKLKRDDGITITELATALFVSSLIVAGAMTWATATLRTQARNQDAVATVDELRFAKSQLTRELRFAAEVIPPSSGDDSISMWLDDGDEIKAVGEIVTYEVMADRTLARYTDDTLQPTKIIAQGLVAAETSFTVASSTIDITLSIDLDPTDEYQSRQVTTSISARNT